VTSLDKLVRGK